MQLFQVGVPHSWATCSCPVALLGFVASHLISNCAAKPPASPPRHTPRGVILEGAAPGEVCCRECLSEEQKNEPGRVFIRVVLLGVLSPARLVGGGFQVLERGSHEQLIIFDCHYSLTGSLICLALAVKNLSRSHLRGQLVWLIQERSGEGPCC